ncbi:SVIP protein, partial [Certhia brachydactyla]|nr:SVIP protein [Certhia brachydactyla]
QESQKEARSSSRAELDLRRPQQLSSGSAGRGTASGMLAAGTARALNPASAGKPIAPNSVPVIKQLPRNPLPEPLSRPRCSLRPGAARPRRPPAGAGTAGASCGAVWAGGLAMGQCLPCMGGAGKDVVETPDPEVKRRQLAEAAEKRQMEASSRGIKNVYSVEQKKKKQEEIERRIASSRSGGEGGLR